MKRKKFFILGTAIVALVAISAMFIKTGGTEVETVTVSKGEINRRVTDTGYVQPVKSYDLYAVQSGRVINVPVQNGARVKKGQTIAVLENNDLNLQISEMQSQLSQANSTAEGARAAMGRTELELKEANDNLTRVTELFQEGAVSRVEYDKAVLRVQSLQETLNEQKSMYNSAQSRKTGLGKSLKELNIKADQLSVTSPVDGLILNLPAQEELYVNPGTLLATVAGQERLEVKADILSDDLAEVKIGQDVDITAPVLGQKTLRGRVTRIYPRAEEKQSALGVTQRRVPVIVSLDDPAVLKPGYEVKVAINTLISRDILVVPRQSVLVKNDGAKEIMVVSGDRVERRQIKTGLSDSEKLEVIDGVKAGEQIIQDGSLELKDNAKIKPLT